MLCLFCGQCCRKNHPTAFHDLETGCYKLTKIGTFFFCKEYADRPSICIRAIAELQQAVSCKDRSTYCVFGMSLLCIKDDAQASERREDGLKLIEELYGEKHGKRFNRRYQIN